MEQVGLPCCPKDAVSEVKKVCKFKSKYNGGRGAVRELCDFILKSQNIEPLEIVRQKQQELK